MAVTRVPSHSGKTGAQWAPDVDDSLAASFGLVGGRLQSVAGTNTITATLSHPTGFTAYPDGFKCTLVPINNNTGSVTLNIASVGAVSVRDQDGAVLAANALVAGRAQPLIYDSSGGYFRFDGSAKPDTTTVTAAVFNKVSVHTANGSFVTPAASWYRVHVIGGGGSGAGGDGGATRRLSGGAAGGYCRKTVYLESGVTITIAVGAGGAGVGATNTNGNAGAASSASGTGLGTLTANGGNGGVYHASSATGATGGTASGGDVNVTGQTSSTITTGGMAGAGGGIGLISQLTALANNIIEPTNLWTALIPVGSLMCFSAYVLLRGGRGHNNGGAPPSDAAPSTNAGGGSAGRNDGLGSSQNGATGAVIIEYED